MVNQTTGRAARDPIVTRHGIVFESSEGTSLARDAPGALGSRQHLSHLDWGTVGLLAFALFCWFVGRGEHDAGYAVLFIRTDRYLKLWKPAEPQTETSIFISD